MSPSPPPGARPTPPSLPPAVDHGFARGLYTALRIFGLVVLALMLVAILYAGWISLENWSSIGV